MMDFSIANKLCEVLLYSQFKFSQIEEIQSSIL
jgi:hypothetical protein